MLSWRRDGFMKHVECFFGSSFCTVKKSVT